MFDLKLYFFLLVSPFQSLEMKICPQKSAPEQPICTDLLQPKSKPIKSKDATNSPRPTEYPDVKTAENYTSLISQVTKAASIFCKVRVAESDPTLGLRITFSCLKHTDD